MEKNRKIIHIDMDAFYASIEQRDNPELKGKPVIVGGDPDKRGVVATCSYEARKFDVHSAMASKTAKRLCPQGIFLKPRFDRYKAVSAEIMELFREYTDLVEPLSLDEAFLDVTKNKKGMASATYIAQDIMKAIYEKTGLTASCGVSNSKFVSKVANTNKPNGINVITPQEADKFIDQLPIGKFYGVGHVTEKKMHELGIKTGADLKKMDRDQLINHFGKAGNYFYDIAHGQDNRPVVPTRELKSMGREITFSEDIDDPDQMIEILQGLAVKVEDLIKRHDKKGRTVTLKVKYYDFQSITRSVTTEEPVMEAVIIMKHVRSLFAKTEAGKKKVRLLGISISNFADIKPKKSKQLPFSF